MKKYRIDRERPWEDMTEEERDAWYKRKGIRKPTEEEKAVAIENFYRRFPKDVRKIEFSKKN